MNALQARALVVETFPKSFDKVRFHQFAKELLNGFNEDKTAGMAVPDAFAAHVRSCFRLTQKTLAELFGVKRPAITKHLRNIFQTGELAEDAVSSILEHTAGDGKKYGTKYYNLDAIIAVGYRVNSHQATQFRIWATKTLREFIIKGFVLDDERLKQGRQVFGKDYFDELLERIREIRASERRFYQKITDLYALAVDYDANAPVTQEFFATVQNNLHWAITGQTAAEIIYARADATKIYMGLTTWKHAPRGKILKSDVAVAKNYLSEAHVKELNRIVSAYLDLAENRAQRGLVTKMADWLKFLHDFLALSSYPILQDKGKVSALEAKLKAEGEFEVYRKRQDAEFISDFDREIKRIEGGKARRINERNPMSEPLPAPAASNTFERIKRVTAEGRESWSARDLARVLEYLTFRNFQPVIEKAKEACAKSGHAVADHFAEMRNMVDIGSGARRELEDWALSRYACCCAAR